MLSASRGADEPALDKLRTEHAKHYLDPDAHMALARYYHDNSNRIQAFLLLEYCRRRLFTRAQFDEAFDRAFVKRDPFDNSKEAEAALLKKHAQEPKSPGIAVKLADIYISRDDWGRAKEYLTKAINLDPEDFTNVEALAEVLRRDKKPKEATKVVQDYLEKHPKSREAYRRKIDPLMKKDPAAATRLVTEALEKYPKEGPFLFNMGVLLQGDKKLKEAEEHFVKAAALAKDSAHIQGWTGRFFLKVREDEGKALDYYLSAYFLDPHFYDSEYAEQRIGKIALNLAQQKYATLKKRDPEKVSAILSDDHPMVVGLALDDMGKKWARDYAKPVAAMLSHDDEYVRAKALRALLANLDRSYDNDIKALLKDRDLRKKGMAGYLAVKLWDKEGLKEVEPWLKDDVQLLRYDAISALHQFGGAPGRALVTEHRKQEKHPWFKKWLETLDKEK
jgi:Tfp pilus assembly protein PilF